ARRILVLVTSRRFPPLSRASVWLWTRIRRCFRGRLSWRPLLFRWGTAESHRRCKAAPLVNPSRQAPLRITLCLRSQVFCYFTAICTGGGCHDHLYARNYVSRMGHCLLTSRETPL